MPRFETFMACPRPGVSWKIPRFETVMEPFTLCLSLSRALHGCGIRRKRPRRAGNRPLSPYLPPGVSHTTPRSVAALERVRLRPRAVAGLSHERNQRNDTGTGRASLFPDRGVSTRKGREAGAGEGEDKRNHCLSVANMG